MKNIALIIYPDCSIQEVSLLMYLFRWTCDAKTVTFAATREPIVSEEGLCIIPEKTYEEFCREDYYCLVLSGSSDFRGPINDQALLAFLKQFQDDHDFVIGAICGGPLFLARAGLLDHHKFTNSLYVEMNEKFRFIHEENIVYAPLVEDGNIITAVGNASRQFAIALANKVGIDCPIDALKGVQDTWVPDDFKHHLSLEERREFEEAYQDFL